jgi:dephospho-CoA kinase
MIIIGLTGIIGSGKSTVTALLRKRGLDVLDFDALARESLTWEETRRDIREAFGEEYIINGRVDTEALGKAVFSDSEKRRKLESLIHPRVAEKVEERLLELEGSGRHAAVIDHPLLFEVGFHRELDMTVVVTANTATIRERLIRRGMKIDDVERRLAAQKPLEEKERMADFVIDNNGGEDQLAQQVDSLVEKITKWEVK